MPCCEVRNHPGNHLHRPIYSLDLWQICCTIKGVRPGGPARRSAHMKPFHLRVAIVVAGLTLAAGPALAQDPRGGGGGGGAAERTGGGGAAANSGGGNSAGGNVAGSSGGGSASSGVSSVSSPSFGAASSPSISGSDRGFIQPAPQHRLSYSSDGARTASGGGQHATPRSSGSS